MVQRIKKMLFSLKVDLLEPVVTRGFPGENDFRALDRLADDILNRHKEHNLVD